MGGSLTTNDRLNINIGKDSKFVLPPYVSYRALEIEICK